MDLRFEWSEHKARANLSKHGVSFDEARTVFLDEDALLLHDAEHSEDEQRFVLLGLSSYLRTLVVCHCYQNDERIRIVSARKANRRELEQYAERRTQ